jgi:glycosyltransferase involved in cell wall biosynthesis
MLGRDHEVHTLTRKPYKDLPDYEFCDGIHIHRYPGPHVGSSLYWMYPIFNYFAGRYYLVKLIKHNRFDGIIFNQPFSALGFFCSGCFTDIKKIYIFHSVSHSEFRMALLRRSWFFQGVLCLLAAFIRKVERFAVHGCDEIVTLSRYMKDVVTSLHGQESKRVKVIPGGVDTKIFSPVSSFEEKMTIREKFGIPKKAFVLFVAKRLYGEMGLENIIEAMELLCEKEENIYLLLAGTGPLREELEKLIVTKRLESRIRLLGNVPYNQMVYYYQLADLFISTRSEAFGLVMLEALACALPVLSVTAGAAVEILEGFSENLLFKGTNSMAMAHLILKYQSSPEILKTLQSKCRQYVENKYTWSVAAEKMEQLLLKRDM